MLPHIVALAQNNSVSPDDAWILVHLLARLACIPVGDLRATKGARFTSIISHIRLDLHPMTTSAAARLLLCLLALVAFGKCASNLPSFVEPKNDKVCPFLFIFQLPSEGSQC